jgi:hypothetical protein
MNRRRRCTVIAVLSPATADASTGSSSASKASQMPALREPGA